MKASESPRDRAKFPRRCGKSPTSTGPICEYPPGFDTSHQHRLALSLPYVKYAVPMTNITALLLVLTMTGVPVASIVCVAECQPEPATWGHCHGDMAASDRPMMFASDSCNDPSIGDSPFVIEYRAVPGAA